MSVLCCMTAFLILARALLAPPAVGRSAEVGKVVVDVRALNLVLQSVEFSTRRLADGGEVRVRLSATTHTDVQPRSCSGELIATANSFELPFSSCSAQRIGPSRYELVLKRVFPAAVVNRAFHLGGVTLSGSAGERYASPIQTDEKLDVISTAVVPDLRSPRLDLRSESGRRWIRPGGRFHIDLYMDSATPVEVAGFMLNLFPRDGRGVDYARLLVPSEGESPSGWIERVERRRLYGQQWLRVYAVVPEDLRGFVKLDLGSMGAMNQSLQCLELTPKGLGLDIQEFPPKRRDAPPAPPVSPRPKRRPPGSAAVRSALTHGPCV